MLEKKEKSVNETCISCVAILKQSQISEDILYVDILPMCAFYIIFKQTAFDPESHANIKY